MKKNNMIFNDPIILITKKSLLDLPVPFSINKLWNKGFMMSLTLILQIVTGLVLSMNFVASTDLAFNSVIHIMRDMESGWIMRYLHMNGASLFFILMYTHIARGIYFNSPMKVPMMWISGVVLLLLSMAAAFLGYVLPWGQMSYWGATVITSMISAIPYVGKEVTQWLWGNFSVSQPTLNRFFSLHFILPLAVAALALAHLMMLHKTGSSNPTGTNPNYDKIKFFSFFFVKDLSYFLQVMTLMAFLLIFSPNMLGDVENFNMASIATTPAHIQPEWYFLFAYAILRSIPSKLGGVLAMIASILVLLVLMAKKKNIMVKKFSPLSKAMFWAFIATVILLTWIGANPVEPPFSEIGQVLTAAYFFMFMMI